ncbi:hypothetical protein TVNIR_2456 [Thioalkalivibrio nitratireducens DSM 14787]|uniref:Uncharacterized protein n=1 Tax=Thioalkalivibrio nitratireducens (strain DSM 14787 / UNIQEM 213 / ALEN2) TaxID=1255043 RepID=L0DYG7_THIND|nr:hypothetical protein [Thioalkalivibrio nitratireducens]AGA34098.1 hypothetical protein TVNIR_2456 [Thioalkalivibrio nitratireducens DSM 14787]
MIAMRILSLFLLVGVVGIAPPAEGQDASILPLLRSPPEVKPFDPSGRFDFPLAPIPSPASSPELPEEWNWHEVFGVRLGLPKGFTRTPTDEVDESRGVAAYFGNPDASLRSVTAIGLHFTRPETMAVAGLVSPEAVARSMSRQFPFTVAATGETVPLLGEHFDVLSGEDRSLFGLSSRRLSVYLGRTVNSWGYLPMVTILHTNLSERRATELNAAILASLHAIGGIEIGMPDPRQFEGLVQVRVPPGGRWVSPGSIRFREGRRGPLHAELLMQQLGPLENAALLFLESRFAVLPRVTEGTVEGIPVWVLNGPALNVPGADASGDEAGPAWQRRSLITRLCPPSAGPVVLSAAVGPDQTMAQEDLLKLPRLTLPDDAAPCPDLYMAPLQALFDGRPIARTLASVSQSGFGSPSPMVAPISEVVDLMGGMVRLSVPENGRIRHEELLLSDTPRGVPYASVRTRVTGATEEQVRNLLRDLFDGPLEVREEVFGGQRVWIAEGRSRHLPGSNVRTVEGDGWRRMALVTQVCPARFGPLAAIASTHEDRIAQGLTLDALLGLAEIRMRGDSVPCPDETMRPLSSLTAQGAAN